MMQLLNVEMDASIRLSLLSVIMCTVYQVSVCSSPSGGDKCTAQKSLVGGHLVILFFPFVNCVQYPAGVSCQWYIDLKICIIYFVFPFVIYFSAILFSVCQGTLWKLYAQNHVASCNGCSHQSDHIEINCSFNFLITHLG